jgi:protein transport protein SEC13
MVTTSGTCIETSHEDMIHDAQLDYYGKRLATCSSDRTIKVFDVQDPSKVQVLRGHDGPIWQVGWAHPRFGSILASCSYDQAVFVWREHNSEWQKVKDHRIHKASVNAIEWKNNELILACASSDGKISILESKDDATWDSSLITAHNIGANSISWAPIPTVQTQTPERRFASGGCDNLVKIFCEKNGIWTEESVLAGHTDWVRDVAFAPNVGFGRTYLASCSQDKTVLIWTQVPGEEWKKRLLKEEPFGDVVWRVSWSLGGNILAVSCGDNKVTLWKENVDGVFAQVGDVNE